MEGVAAQKPLEATEAQKTQDMQRAAKAFASVFYMQLAKTVRPYGGGETATIGGKSHSFQSSYDHFLIEAYADALSEQDPAKIGEILLRQMQGKAYQGKGGERE